MSTNLTRRQFGALTVAAACICVPRTGWTQSSTYANPHLLMEPGELMAVVSPTGSLQPESGPEGLVIVDVRPRPEFDAGHVPGARHLDPNAVVARFSPIDGTLRSVAEMEKLLSDLGVSADRKIVFYDDRGGFHAARMFWLMEYLGHRGVAVLNGGWSGWRAVNGPVAVGENESDPGAFQAAVSPRRHAGAADVLDARQDPDGVLIDVRSGKMYADGHIPWAINVPWSQNLGPDGRFLDADALQAHFLARGIAPENNVIMHCQNGLASSHSYVALRLLGYPSVRVYHRSWAEWGSDPALPKSTS
ncbi:MAG: sulfurtransferase [Alphaproteobacteria bacterium]|nr:sulfurtransferase [Alphaproteobacteria bacterium]